MRVKLQKNWNRIFGKNHRNHIRKITSNPTLFTTALLGGAAGVTYLGRLTKQVQERPSVVAESAITPVSSHGAPESVPYQPVTLPQAQERPSPDRDQKREQEETKAQTPPPKLLSFAGIKSLFMEAFNEWSEDKAPRLGAALAYYTVFSLAPLLVVVIAVAGLAFGAEAVQNQLMTQVKGLVGKDGGEAIQGMVLAARKPSRGLVATVIGLVTLLIGATGVFGELQDALNQIWDVTKKQASGIMAMLRQRFVSFAMILGIAFLLLVSLVVSAGLAAFGNYAESIFGMPEFLMHGLNFIVSFGFVTLLFALMFKFIPDRQIAWNDVWIGAAVTAVLFVIGKYLIGLYIASGSVGSGFGAAGSLVIVLVWVYYSTQIIFMGAEFAQVYTKRYGSGSNAANL